MYADRVYFMQQVGFWDPRWKAKKKTNKVNQVNVVI